jgi:histidinol phosphatase-like enzyme
MIKQPVEDLSGKIKIALDKGIRKLIAETKAANLYLVISNKDGKIKKYFHY